MVYVAATAEFQYQYTLSDHLGNVRLTFTDENEDGLIDTNPTAGEILQEDQFYPFGLRLGGLSFSSGVANRYRFQGHELQDELGLNTYSTFFREYDPTIGRWMQIDPKVREFESPYVGMANNPMLYLDILGDTNTYYFDANGEYTGRWEEDDGPHRGVWERADGSTITFVFGDQENDHKNLFNLADYGGKLNLKKKSEKWYKVQLQDDSEVKRRLDNAGVFEEENRNRSLSYIEKQHSGGRLDFRFWMEDIIEGIHLVVGTPEGSYGFSKANYGNFLIGAGYAVLTDGLAGEYTTRTLAHLFSIFNDEYWRDSPDDQLAISLGFEYYKANYTTIVEKEYYRSRSGSKTRTFTRVVKPSLIQKKRP